MTIFTVLPRVRRGVSRVALAAVAGVAAWLASPAHAQVSGSLVQWGRTSEGQANNQPPLAGPYVAIASGSNHSLALKPDGSLVQWGDTSQGQTLGQPPLAGPYSAIAAGGATCLALKTDGSLVQWGNTSVGQTNNQPPLAGPYIAIAAGGLHCLALKADGSLVQWGATASGQALGQPALGGPYIAIAAGERHSLALKAHGSLVQWGDAGGGQTTNQPPLAGPYIAIAAGFTHSLALKADGSLVQWGGTGNGQTTNQPSLAGPYIAIAAGWNHSFALRPDGSLVQWGQSSQGQATNQPSLTGPYAAVRGGFGHSIAIAGTPVTPTTITYQGLLTGATGAVDLRFRVYTAATGGSTVGSAAFASNVTPDTVGRVTVPITLTGVDFSSPRYLEISVAPTGTGTYTVLSPRQPLTQAPRAAYADRAGGADNALTADFATSAGTVPWAGVTGVPANISTAFSPWVSGAGGVISYSGGNVGVGTTTPLVPVDIATPINAFGLRQLGGTVDLRTRVDNLGGMVGTWSSHPLVLMTNSLPAATITQSGLVGIGTTTPTQRLHVIGNILATGTITPSSQRLKDNVMPMSDALERLLRLDGVRFDWKPDEAAKRDGRVHDLGFIAEQVAAEFPEVVFTDEQGNVTGMDYARLTAVAVQAIKQQQSQFAAELAKRDAENADLKARLERLEAALKRSEAKP